MASGANSSLHCGCRAQLAAPKAVRLETTNARTNRAGRPRDVLLDLLVLVRLRGAAFFLLAIPPGDRTSDQKPEDCRLYGKGPYVGSKGGASTGDHIGSRSIRYRLCFQPYEESPPQLGVLAMGEEGTWRVRLRRLDSTRQDSRSQSRAFQHIQGSDAFKQVHQRWRRAWLRCPQAERPDVGHQDRGTAPLCPIRQLWSHTQPFFEHGEHACVPEQK